MTPRLFALALLFLLVVAVPLAANDTGRDCRGLVALTDLDHAIAPDRIEASRPGPEPEFTRPLCAHPKAAKYEGEGDVNDAANWSCR